MRKELTNQNKLQSAILRKLELWNHSPAIQSSTEPPAFYLFLYDSKDRKFLFRNIHTNGYETLPGARQYAISLLAQKSEIQLEIIKQIGITRALEKIELNLNSGADNYVDIAEYVT